MPIEGTDALTLTSLEVENILRLKAIKLLLDPEGALIVEGKNEAGKSSVLRSLEILLAGMAQTPDEPIHGDETKGRIVGRFGDVVVTKTFGRGKRPILKITSAGATASSPQKLLDTLLDHVALDPLKFLGHDPQTQLRILSDLTGADESEIDRRQEAAYQYRREANRVVRDLEGAIAALNVDPDAPAEEVSVTELMGQLEVARKHNQKGEHLEAINRDARYKADALHAKISELETALKIAHEEYEAAHKAQTAAAKAAIAFEPMDEDEISAKLKAADEINRKARAAAAARRDEERLTAQRAVVDKWNAELAAIAAEREAMRAKAQERLPVPDLAITAEGVLYKGKPLAQAGSSAQLRVSVAVAIAANKDSRIKLLLIDDAEKLDANNTRLVLELAREAGFQVLMARVGDGRESTVLIEDGVVASGVERKEG